MAPPLYFGVGFDKGNFFDLLAVYCANTPPIDKPVQETVKELDKKFAPINDSAEWEAFASFYQEVQDRPGHRSAVSANVLQAAIFYYSALYENDKQAYDIGWAKTHLALMGVAISQKIDTAMAAKALYYDVAPLCEFGDQFYCGAKEALQERIDDNSFPYRMPGRTFAPIFGETLWREHDRHPTQTARSCGSIDDPAHTVTIKKQ